MNKIFFAVGLITLSFSSCKKEEAKGGNYSVSEMGDFVVDRNPFDKNFGTVLPQLLFGVKQAGGESKRVTLSVEGLPAGITDSLSIQGGYPDFNTALFLKDVGAAVGDYSPVLKLKADGFSAVGSHPFKLTLKGFGTCASYFANREFEAESDCPLDNPVIVNYKTSSILLHPGSDTVVMNNYRNSGLGMKIFFNCQKRTFEVPAQIIGDKSVVGIGYDPLINDESGLPTSLHFTILEMYQNVPYYCRLTYKFK